MKITAYAIAKNETNNINAFLETVHDFDEVVVVDTGSTDATVQMLRDAGVRVIEHAFEPFDFSKARNYSLARVSKDTDWCFSLDFNERIDTAWREKFEHIITLCPHTTAVEIMRYDEYVGEVRRGSEDKLILHKRDGYAWKNAVHEVLSLRDGYIEEKYISDIAITKKIQRTDAKEDFYATICLREYRRDPVQSFYLWFLIGYYYDRREWQKTIEYGLLYIDATARVKSDFRVYTFTRISQSLYELGDKYQGFRYGMLGFAEALFFPKDAVFGQAVNHMLHYALVTNNSELHVYMMSFMSHE